MATFAFEIEFVAPNGRFVLARQLGRGAFRLGPGSRLGEVPVSAADMPRALGPDGAPRLDIFGFTVSDPVTASRLRVGQIVELRADEEPGGSPSPS